MIAYLASIDLSRSAETLREELNIGDSFDSETSKKYEGLLEKKWTSVGRLQKKVGFYGQLFWGNADLSTDNGTGVKSCKFTRGA